MPGGPYGVFAPASGPTTLSRRGCPLLLSERLGALAGRVSRIGGVLRRRRLGGPFRYRRCGSRLSRRSTRHRLVVLSTTTRVSRKAPANSNGDPAVGPSVLGRRRCARRRPGLYGIPKCIVSPGGKRNGRRPPTEAASVKPVGIPPTCASVKGRTRRRPTLSVCACRCLRRAVGSTSALPALFPLLLVRRLGRGQALVRPRRAVAQRLLQPTSGYAPGVQEPGRRPRRRRAARPLRACRRGIVPAIPLRHRCGTGIVRQRDGRGNLVADGTATS